ncbi:MAG TPA: AI-2E family transporter [Steroidobacteraceae bacterium]|nr:AI-2E family transporter [Steroidobacteraceae bacterium]
MHQGEEAQEPAPPAASARPLRRPEAEQQRPDPQVRAPSAAFRALVRPLWILAVCALVLVLRQMREALIPLVLAFLIALIFSGVVERLRRHHVPRAVSALVLLLLGGIALGGALEALWTPAQDWIQSAPRILKVIEHKVRPARAIVVRLNDIATRAAAVAGAGTDPRQAVASASHGSLTALDVLAETGWVVGGTVTVAALTLLLLATGPPTLATMTAALAAHWHAVQVLQTIDAIRVEVGRYYSTLALINLSLGSATALSMWLLNMPTPVLWGAMAAVLNFIPYLGSAFTLLTISLVAVVTFDSLAHILLVPLTFLVLATIEGQIIEPIFFGRRLRLNPIVVFVALWLGGWLWGIAGVLLALPILVATKVAAAQPGGHDGILRFLAPAGSRGSSAQPAAVSRGSRVEVPTMLRARTRR